MINLNAHRNIIEPVLKHLGKMNYDELMYMFGSIEAQDIQILAKEMHIADVCEYFQIDRKEYDENAWDYEEDYAINMIEG